MATIAISMALALCFTFTALLFIAVKSRWTARSRMLRRKMPIKGEFLLHHLNLTGEGEEKIKKVRIRSRNAL